MCLLCVRCVDALLCKQVLMCVHLPAWRVGPARHRSWPATATPPPAPPHEGSTADRTCTPTATTGLSFMHWPGLVSLSMATPRVSWQASSRGPETHVSSAVPRQVFGEREDEAQQARQQQPDREERTAAEVVCDTHTPTLDA